jgi:nitrate/TMAO reductase-like tetraheme cytochrome c subunit
MFDQFSTLLAVLLLVLAGVTVLIMLEMNNTRTSEKEKGIWFIIQRVFGYVFLVLFAILLGYLLIKIGSIRDEIPTSILIYTALALILIPLVLIKVVIARRQARVSTKLTLLGIALFGLAFGLTGLTALQGKNEKYGGEHAQGIMSKKCSKCHSLERIYQTYKPDWNETVNRMAQFDYPNINNAEMRQIVQYLTEQQEKIQPFTETNAVRSLISRKCSICHNLDKIYKTKLNQKEWTDIVADMIRIMGDPNFLSLQEQEEIVQYLSSRQSVIIIESKTVNPDNPRALLELKCSAGCHDVARIERIKKSREEWIETVYNMVEISGDPKFLTVQEMEDIVNFLSRDNKGQDQEQEQEVEDQDIRPNSAKADHPLLITKCSGCHNLERIYRTGKSKEEWATLVNNMAYTSGYSNFLTDEERRDILNIISTLELVQ